MEVVILLMTCLQKICVPSKIIDANVIAFNMITNENEDIHMKTFFM